MNKPTNIILLGLGKVGRELVQQVLSSGLNICFIAIADSRAFISGSPLSAVQIETALRTKDAGQTLSNLKGSSPLSDLTALYQRDTIVVDTSASRDLDLTPALAAECKLVYANKNALSAPWAQTAGLYSKAQVAYEATVGAGLPVIQTLHSLMATGDTVTKIEGVMSGTLGFLCSRLEDGATYSQAVQQSFDAGYTEPDPRDDLSGFDVARKALILGRTAGWRLEMEQVKVEALFQPALANIPLKDFFEQMATMDDDFSQKVAIAKREGKVLRYLAAVTKEGGTVGLQSVDKSSALGALQGPGNYFAFYTVRYPEIPLVIAGPGAGVAVTAAGVFADILTLI
jgi:homoserine dehydrogenase